MGITRRVIIDKGDYKQAFCQMVGNLLPTLECISQIGASAIVPEA
jgi:hypothetical protein